MMSFLTHTAVYDKNRSAYWDNIKGILIILMVFAHFLYDFQQITTINTIVYIIYTFHMPAFVFVSGYFGKSEKAHSFYSIVKFVFLYYVFNSIMGFLYDSNSLTVPNYSYWYLIALAVWRLTAHRLAKFKEIQLILFTVSIFIGFFPSIDNTFAISRILAFYPFYMAGYLLSKEKSDKLLSLSKLKKLLYGLCFLIVGGIIIYLALVIFKYSNDALTMFPYITPLDAFGRCVLFVIAYLMILALRYLTPNKKIPLITLFGKNSLWIFIFHRPVVLEIQKYMMSLSTGSFIAASILLTIVCCAVFGCDIWSNFMNKFSQAAAELFTYPQNTKDNPKGKKAVSAVSLLVALWYIVTILLNAYSGFSLTDTSTANIENNSTDIIYRTLTAEQKADFENAFKITFAGDLILLEDQVKRAYNDGSYDFSDMFEYSKKYISSSDYAIGVFEGPVAGGDKGYSVGNFDDGKQLYLNFPDEFALAVKNAGFDLVTTANNHLLDKGIDGAMRTLDVLDNYGLDNIGSYRNAEEKEKEHIKFIEKDGIKMAVLAYTYGSNYTDTEYLGSGKISYITSVIDGTEGEFFELMKANVEKDFEAAYALDPDLIIVLPHLGTQFSNTPDETQEVWFKIFKDLGADIILGDHPHVIEPAFVEEYNGKNVFTAYCPGNFANIYRENQGDTSALIDVYIDRNTKQVIGGGIVPLYTQAQLNGNFRALPIYEIENNDKLRQQLSTDDYELAKRANNTITKVVFGNTMDITSVSESYLFDNEGFIRQKTTGLQLNDEMKNGTLYKQLSESNDVCFIGDSVTEGTKNGGCSWYEPIEEYFDGNVYNFSKGGCTIGYILEHINEIPVSELYVIAIGTNDVRYRDETSCAMTADDFVECADKLKTALLQKNGNARLIFIAPWYSTDGDKFCKLGFAEKKELNNIYSKALEDFCIKNNLGFINANSYIEEKLLTSPDRQYLLDHIHPNSTRGVRMYSEAVLYQK